jgi:hypothetical protein
MSIKNINRIKISSFDWYTIAVSEILTKQIGYVKLFEAKDLTEDYS